jgi:hypothetical protein
MAKKKLIYEIGAEYPGDGDNVTALGRVVVWNNVTSNKMDVGCAFNRLFKAGMYVGSSYNGNKVTDWSNSWFGNSTIPCRFSGYPKGVRWVWFSSPFDSMAEEMEYWATEDIVREFGKIGYDVIFYFKDTEFQVIIHKEIFPAPLKYRGVGRTMERAMKNAIKSFVEDMKV